MKILDSPDFYGKTIFCDDIRQEVGGKLSLIGIYSDRLFVHGEFPFVLPKFGMYVTCVQRHQVMKPISRFVAFLPGDDEDGDPSVVAEFGTEPMQKAIEESRLNPSEHGVFGAITNILLSPLVIQKPGTIKVRAVRDDEMIRCGTLFVAQHPTYAARAAEQSKQPE